MRRVFRFGQRLHGSDVPSVPSQYRSGPDSPSGRLAAVTLRPASGELWLSLRAGGLPGRGQTRTVPLGASQPSAPSPDALTLSGGMRVRGHDGIVGKLEGIRVDTSAGVALELLVHVRGNILAEMESNSSPLAPLLEVANQDVLLSPTWAVSVTRQPGPGLFGTEENVLLIDASPEQIASATVLRPDADLAGNIISILGENPALEPYVGGITVDVHDGNVTVRGAVPSPRHRASAEQDIWHVPGVLAVRNELAVRG